MTFEEDSLQDLYKAAVVGGIEFSNNYVSADMYVLAVPTPYDKDSKRIDPSYVVNALKEVMKVCRKGVIVCIESTVSPGTIDRYIRPVVTGSGMVIGKDIHLVHTPERIIPGNMIPELINNSRTIGADDAQIGEKVKSVYQSFCKADNYNSF